MTEQWIVTTGILFGILLLIGCQPQTPVERQSFTLGDTTLPIVTMPTDISMVNNNKIPTEIQSYCETQSVYLSELEGLVKYFSKSDSPVALQFHSDLDKASSAFLLKPEIYSVNVYQGGRKGEGGSSGFPI